MYVIDLLGKLAPAIEPLRAVSAFRYYGSAIQDGIDVSHVLAHRSRDRAGRHRGRSLRTPRRALTTALSPSRDPRQVASSPGSWPTY
jgi:hypothetical protein